MRFLSVGSHLCSPASFRPLLAETPLPSACTFGSIDFHQHHRFSYRGLSPHKLTPMPGVHKQIQRMANSHRIYSSFPPSLRSVCFYRKSLLLQRIELRTLVGVLCFSAHSSCSEFDTAKIYPNCLMSFAFPCYSTCTRKEARGHACCPEIRRYLSSKC